MKFVSESPWSALKGFTPARIALGRAGDSLPTEALLDFAMDHARARDAVHVALPTQEVATAMRNAGLAVIFVHSAAADRATYLRRPDLGRRLDEASVGRAQAAAHPDAACPSDARDATDVVFVIADGLSANAAATHVPPLLQALAPYLHGWRIGPIVIAEQARVALGDEIGALLHAQQVVMLIGERPGLSSPDSLGVYLTWAPHVGCTDAERNCISNVRPQGLGYAAAAHRLAWLLGAARERRLTGVALKDESNELAGPTPVIGP